MEGKEVPGREIFTALGLTDNIHKAYMPIVNITENSKPQNPHKILHQLVIKHATVLWALQDISLKICSFHMGVSQPDIDVERSQTPYCEIYGQHRDLLVLQQRTVQYN